MSTAGGRAKEAMSERPARAWSTAYHAAWVFPVAGEPIADGTVLIEADRIAWVGPRAAKSFPPHVREVELGDALLTPGLVNAHTHLDLTVLRGLLDGEPFFDWIRAIVAAREVLSHEETLDSARAGILEGLQAGVTTFADTAPGAAGFLAMRELGVRGVAYLEVFGPDASQCEHAMSGLRARVAAIRMDETRLVRVGVSPHAPYSVSDELYAAAAAYARFERLPLATHVAESVAESELVSGGRGAFAEFLVGRGIAATMRARTPIALLERNGVLGADALLIHCVRCDDEDIATIARSGAAVVACPNSNRYFGHGVAPAEAIAAAGVRLGIGSDSMASNTRMDLLAEAHAAVPATTATTAGDVWRTRWELATIGGARALGLGDAIGTLEAGKQADLAAFPIRAGSTFAQAIEFAPSEGARAQHVVVGGSERVRNGRATADTGAMFERAAAATTRLREWRTRARVT